MKRQLITSMAMVAVSMSWAASAHGQDEAIGRAITGQRETALEIERTRQSALALVDDSNRNAISQAYRSALRGARTFYATEDLSQQTKLASILVKTDDLAERQAAQAELTKLLNESFDKDIERRKSELDAIKKRLAEMQAVLDKRILNKQKIVDLRIQVLTNQANDLDWSAVPSGRAFRAQPTQVLFDVPVTDDLKIFPSPRKRIVSPSVESK